MPKKTASRVQLYLEPQQYEFLVREAKRQGSVAAVVRSLIDEKLEGKNLADDPIAGLTDLASAGAPRDLSTKHDEYLYGGTARRKK